MDGIIDVMSLKERFSQSNEQELVIKKEQELKSLGKQRVSPGHTLFSLNLKTREVKKAIYEKTPVCWASKNQTTSFKKKIVIEADCFYYQALNEKNFIKKLAKFGLIVKANE